MKDFLLYLLIVVAVGELITLGLMNYPKSLGKVLSSSTQALVVPTPQETDNTSVNDYLALLVSPNPIATEVASILFIPTPLPSSTPIPTKKPTSKPSASPSGTPILTLPSTTPAIASTTPTASPKASPSQSPLILAKYSSQEINGFIDRFAGQYGVDPNVIRHIALCESGFNPLAKYLSYGGLFQFSSSTWEGYRKKMGEDTNPELRFNAEEAVQTATYVLSINKGGIWPNCKP